jgi:hypothetical protein
MIKNDWSCTSAPPMCLHGTDRENFTEDTVRISNTLCSKLRG